MGWKEALWATIGGIVIALFLAFNADTKEAFASALIVVGLAGPIGGFLSGFMKGAEDQMNRHPK